MLERKQQAKKNNPEEIFAALSECQIGPASNWESHPLPSVAGHFFRKFSRHSTVPSWLLPLVDAGDSAPRVPGSARRAWSTAIFRSKRTNVLRFVVWEATDADQKLVHNLVHTTVINRRTQWHLKNVEKITNC